MEGIQSFRAKRNERKTLTPSGEEDFISKMDPAFIHQILMTDPSHFSCLTVPSSHEGHTTLSFREFTDSLEGSDINADTVVKKAIRDHILEGITQKSEDLEPLKELVLELHDNLRSLIPNRRDLHSILDDSQVRNIGTVSELKTSIIKAAHSLQHLESEARGRTTLQLLEELEHGDDQNVTSQVSLCLDVVFYLMHKAELCEADKEQFYLENIWAPRIHKEGPALEKRNYENRFGSFTDPNSSPATRQWIQSLLDTKGRENDPDTTILLNSEDARKDLVRAGWIEDILFRTGSQKSLQLPEILSYDQERLQILRQVSRVAVAGCALALHACNAAGANSQVLTNVEGAGVQQRRKDLLQALKYSGESPAEYETHVAQAVVGLAQEWNDSMENEAVQSLHSRVVAVLRGQDPVLTLLNNRIKEAMRDIVLESMCEMENGEFPSEIKSGRSTTSSSFSKKETKQLVPSAVERLFCQRGLAFFASELAVASRLAGKTINLAIRLYWDDLLDKIVLDSCHSQQVLNS